MKKIIALAILTGSLVLGGYAQDSKTPSQTPQPASTKPTQTTGSKTSETERPKVERPQPNAVYQVGSARVSMYERKKRDKTGEKIEKSYQVQRVFVREGEERTSNTFTMAELTELKAAIEKAIAEEKLKEKK